MRLHPLAERFASVADRYERGRPDYPPAVVGALMAELRLRPRALVLDLAAGTGKLTRALLAAGLDAVAVEPQAALRELLAANIGSERVREGFAEAIPLPDGSLDAVTVADAFHWFDHAPALREIARVLAPGGGLAVLSTVPDWREASWGHELGTLIAGLRPQHPGFDGPRWQEAVRADGRFGHVRQITVTTAQPTDPEQMVDYVASMSWVAALPEAQREGTIEQVRAIVAGGQTPAELPVPRDGRPDRAPLGPRAGSRHAARSAGMVYHAVHEARDRASRCVAPARGGVRLPRRDGQSRAVHRSPDVRLGVLGPRPRRRLEGARQREGRGTPPRRIDIEVVSARRPQTIVEQNVAQRGPASGQRHLRARDPPRWRDATSGSSTAGSAPR